MHLIFVRDAAGCASSLISSGYKTDRPDGYNAPFVLNGFEIFSGLSNHSLLGGHHAYLHGIRKFWRLKHLIREGVSHFWYFLFLFELHGELI
jgi:hypothetical protein